MMQASMAKEVADVALRVWTPQHATGPVRQAGRARRRDLIGRCAQMAPQAVDYPTGAWGTESRDYHLCVDVEPGRIGQEMLAARVSLILNTASGRRALGQGLIRAIWTEGEALSTRMSRHVAHYTGQAELAQAIQDGLEARKAGDEDSAALRLGRAVVLAHESGNEDTANLLAKVVDVIDPATGPCGSRPRSLTRTRWRWTPDRLRRSGSRSNPNRSDGAQVAWTAD